MSRDTAIATRRRGRPTGALALCLIVALFLPTTTAPAAEKDGAAFPQADASTLTGKLVVGFQGWFMCPGDGRRTGGWWHWFTAGKDDADHTHFDLLPDTSELTPGERCATHLTTAAGNTISLFSDQNPETVSRQFGWMAQYGIETAALQRFVVDIDPVHPAAGHEAVDRVLQNVRHAAGQTGRAFFVMYDIVGADPHTWADTLRRDWQQQLRDGLTGEIMYQRHNGHPVLAIAGVGSTDRPGTAEEMLSLIQNLRSDSAAFGGVTLLASTATGWRTLDGDSKTDTLWGRVYRSFDILSPWTVGRYRDDQSYEMYRTQRLAPDIAEARHSGVELMPVIFPGFSWKNLYHSVGGPDQILDRIPRQCGRFLMVQARGAMTSGSTMLYGAMFDEVDEGTALFKITANDADLPVAPPLVHLANADCHVASDWYLTLSGQISKQQKSVAFSKPPGEEPWRH